MKLNQAVCLAALVVAANGCVPVPMPTEAQFEHAGEIARLRSHEAIAILVPAELRSRDFEAAEECLTEAIQSKYPDLSIISSEEFKRSVFAYRIPEGMTRTQYFDLLYSKPAIQERIRALRLRYIFFLESDTKHDLSRSTGLLVGFDVERSSALRVTIHQVGRSETVGKVESRATGWTGLKGIAVGGYGGGFAMFFQGMAFTETRICDEFAAKIDELLSVEKNPEKAQPGKSRGEARRGKEG